MTAAPPPDDTPGNGWNESARAWIDDMGEHGDFGRRHVLDPAMLARLRGRGFRRALDVGCGEGRVCRLLSGLGIDSVGLDPTGPLLEQARRLHPQGRYVAGVGEALPFPDASFDLVISCLSLIDMPDFTAAIREMARVLAPGGVLFIVNLNGFATARSQAGEPRPPGETGIRIDRYLETRASWQAWRGIRILNWHRPLSAYMRVFLAEGLRLSHFDEPAPVDGEPRRVERYRSAPWYVMMEWEKPADGGNDPRACSP